MDREGHIVDVRQFEAESDLAAIVAVGTASGALLELWCRDRRVAEFPIEQANSGGSVHSVEAGLNQASSSEPAIRAVPTLTLEMIRRVQKARAARSTFLPTELFADAAWDMLLELFACELEQTRLSVGSLCNASGVPPTTALRWIQTLEDRHLVWRENDWSDRRRH
jgi:hypothetical protein